MRKRLEILFVLMLFSATAMLAQMTTSGITCVGLEKGRPGDMITTYKAHNMKEKVMTREKIMALIKKIYKDPGGALAVGGPKELFVSDDRKTVHMVTSGDYPPEPYNPIELE